MLAERVGFEPTCRLPDKSLSRRSRYDHFGTSPPDQSNAERAGAPSFARREAGGPQEKRSEALASSRLDANRHGLGETDRRHGASADADVAAARREHNRRP